MQDGKIMFSLSHEITDDSEDSFYRLICEKYHIYGLTVDLPSDFAGTCDQCEYDCDLKSIVAAMTNI